MLNQIDPANPVPNTPNPGHARHGRHFWLCGRDDAWRMDGIYGQFSVNLPHQEACVTVTTHYHGPTTDILDAVSSEVVPALPTST